MDVTEMQTDEIVNRILADYQGGRDIDRTDLAGHPDKAAVTVLTAKLLRIVYPGYFGGKGCSRYEMPMRIEEATCEMMHQMKPVVQSQEAAGQLTADFFRAIPAVRALAQGDVQAAFDGDPAAKSRDEIIFCYPGLFAITVYRLAHVLHTLGVPMLPRIMTEHAHSLTGIDIHPGAVIGQNFFIDHGTGIVIGETTVIGDRVKIYQGVTLGGLTTRGGQSLRGQKRHPTIGDDVTIYAGASVLGGETVIGCASVIGSNAFITHSIPPCTTVSIKNQQLRYKPHACADCPQAQSALFWADAGENG